jgi:hypothetical protein
VVVESKDKYIRNDVTTSSLLLEKKINILLMEFTSIVFIQNYREGKEG